MKKNHLLLLPALVGMGASLLSQPLMAKDHGNNNNQGNQDRPQQAPSQQAATPASRLQQPQQSQPAVNRPPSNNNQAGSQKDAQVQRSRDNQNQNAATNNNQSNNNRWTKPENRSQENQRPGSQASNDRNSNSNNRNADNNRDSDRRQAENRNSGQRNADRQNYNRGNRYGGRWSPADSHRDWDRNRRYSWNNHQYRWYDGGWLIIDTGYNPFYAYNDRSIEEQVQLELSDQGYYRGPIDGDVGPGTRNAIARYQRDHGLRVTGQINDSLLASLGV